MSMTAPAIRLELRGQEGTFDKIDRLSLGLKRLTSISDDRHYRLCLICSKLQKYEDQKAKSPKKADYYEAKKDMRLRQLIQLIHEHVTDLGPTEHNFYEFLIEAYGILNQEVHFSKDMYTHHHSPIHWHC